MGVARIANSFVAVTERNATPGTGIAKIGTCAAGSGAARVALPKHADIRRRTTVRVFDALAVRDDAAIIRAANTSAAFIVRKAGLAGLYVTILGADEPAAVGIRAASDALACRAITVRALPRIAALIAGNAIDAFSVIANFAATLIGRDAVAAFALFWSAD
ncbi:MAG: hypothetical protein H7Z43_12555 [Clostridia bacterium]|nr:hypothetical protein [Deltaproteobacteria bacterium]